MPVCALDAGIESGYENRAGVLTIGTFGRGEAENIAIEKLPRSKQNKKSKFKKRRINKLLPGQRIWGICSLVLGGYGLLFFIISAIFFIGITFYWYVFVLFLLVGIIGVLLLMAGVSNIDQSYITYSENPALTIDRLRPQMWRDFIFTIILALMLIPLVLLKFYFTASLVLLLIAALLILALLKRGEIRRLKKIS